SSAGAVDSDDLEDDVEKGLALAASSRLKVGFDVGDVVGMTGRQLLDVSDRLGPAKALGGEVGVCPAEHEPFLRCAEAASKDVVEGVEVPSPDDGAERLGHGRE